MNCGSKCGLAPKRCWVEDLVRNGMVLNRPLGQASDVLFARAQKAPKNRRKSSKRGLQWGRGTHTVRAPQFRGSLGFAG